MIKKHMQKSNKQIIVITKAILQGKFVEETNMRGVPSCYNMHQVIQQSKPTNQYMMY